MMIIRNVSYLCMILCILQSAEQRKSHPKQQNTQQQNEQQQGFHRHRVRGYHPGNLRTMTKGLIDSMLTEGMPDNNAQSYVEDHHTKFLRSDKIEKLKAMWKDPIGFPDEHPNPYADSQIHTKLPSLSDKITSKIRLLR